MSQIQIPFSYEEHPDRALHNLYREKSTTLHPMTVIPLYYRRMFPGDKFKFKVAEAILQSQPTFAPLLANWRLRFEWYFNSDANHYGWLDNNKRLTPQEVMNRRRHSMILPTTHRKDGAVFEQPAITGRGGVNDYSGIAPGYHSFVDEDILNLQYDGAAGMPSTSEVSLDFHLTYLNIIRNYHCNRQYPDMPYVVNLNASGIDEDYPFVTYSAKDMDNLFMLLRMADNGCCFSLLPNADDGGLLRSPGDTVPSWILENEDYMRAYLRFKEWLVHCNRKIGGLFCAQYEPDLYQNLLDSDKNLLKSYVTIQNGQVSVESFRLSNHLQHLYDVLFVGGTRAREMSRSRWGVKSNRDYDIPELISVSSEIIGTNLITSNNSGDTIVNGESVRSVPGDMSGNLNTRRYGNHRQTFTAKTPGSLMCIVTLTPLVSYSQNIERHLLELNFEDSFSPQMARKGFEKVPFSDYSVMPTIYTDGGDGSYQGATDYSVSAGSQVAWLREMTDTNRVHGEFSNDGDMEDWVLVRQYSRVDENAYTDNYLGNVYTQPSFSPYGNPVEWQYPFVSQTINDPNFYLQVAFDVSALRPIGRRFMPTLGV